MKTKVYLTRIEDYIPTLLEEKLKEGFDSIGGIRELVSGKKVFVKINQLSNRPPEDAVTTHPLVVEGACKILLDYGARITIGDDIQGEGEKDGFAITGMRDIARKLNVELVNLRITPYKKIQKKENKLVKELYIAKPVLDADIIVNLPKLKTHVQTTLTLAIKNLYGIIPLGERTRYHGVFSKIEDFSEVLVDIFNARRPELNIMDGILGMEGEGPNSGTPRRLGFFLISRDAVAMDTIVSLLIGLKPDKVRHIAIAASRGLGTDNLHDIDITGTALNKLKVNDFSLPKVMWQAFIPAPLYRLVYKLINLRPAVNAQACEVCGRCVERCPVRAIEVKKGRVTIDYSICIGCLCCQEICNSSAVKSVRPFIGEALMRGVRAIQKLTS